MKNILKLVSFDQNLLNNRIHNGESDIFSILSRILIKTLIVWK